MKTEEINEAAQAMLAEVEAAAKAMYEHTFTRDRDLAWEECGPNWRQTYRDQATVALIAASKVNDNVQTTLFAAPNQVGGQGGEP